VLTGGRQKFRCVQLDSRVGGQAADQNNIKQIISREIRNGARNGEMGSIQPKAVDLFSRKAAERKNFQYFANHENFVNATRLRPLWAPCDPSSS
jgi:hypothetical protein